MKKVLIVEDEGIVSLDLRSSLSDFGEIESEIAFTGEEALNMMGKDKFDLVLMDIGLKGKIDGIETAKIVSNEYDIPVVFLTGFADSDTEKKAKIISPAGYMTKPVDEDKLKELITDILF
jgi:CheY-like chemotaxis protein